MLGATVAGGMDEEGERLRAFGALLAALPASLQRLRLGMDRIGPKTATVLREA